MPIWHREHYGVKARVPRAQLGMDVVLEALRLWRERRRKKLNPLLKYARMRHVERAMRPYLEAIS